MNDWNDNNYVHFSFDQIVVVWNHNFFCFIILILKGEKDTNEGITQLGMMG